MAKKTSMGQNHLTDSSSKKRIGKRPPGHAGSLDAHLPNFLWTQNVKLAGGSREPVVETDHFPRQKNNAFWRLHRFIFNVRKW